MAKEFETQGLSKREYFTIHKWVYRKIGKNKCCSICKTNSGRIENALIRGKIYEKKVENFIPLCVKCHSKYDNSLKGVKRSSETKKRISLSKTGRILSAETRQKMSLSKIGKSSHMKGRYGKSSNAAKKIIDTYTGLIYNSLLEAANKKDIHCSTLSMMLNGKKVNNTNLKFL